MTESTFFTASDTLSTDKTPAADGAQPVFFPLKGYDYFTLAFRLVEGDLLDATSFTVGWSLDQRNVSRYDQTLLPSTGVAASSLVVTVPTSDPTTGSAEVLYYAYGRIPVVAPYGAVYVSTSKITASKVAIDVFAWKE